MDAAPIFQMICDGLCLHCYCVNATYIFLVFHNDDYLLKFGIFVHPKRPKISMKKILKVVRSAGISSYSGTHPDIAIVVGGDGTFSYYGRTLSIPMLFVGVNEKDILGSKARLAHIFFDDLAKSLVAIKEGRYIIDERRMFSLNYGTRRYKDILTDVYLERGIFSGCIRYAVSVYAIDKFKCSTNKKFTDYAIGNGVIISTSFGSGGYYSYPDRIKLWNKNNNNRTIINKFSDNKIGICHILPTFLVWKVERERNRNKQHQQIMSYIQYTMPFQSAIKIYLLRDANVRIYGTTADSRGDAIGLNNEITIRRLNRTAKIIQLHNI
jgi:NAD+ kinase